MISQSSFLGIPLRTRFVRRAIVVGYYSLLALFPVVALVRGHANVMFLLPQTFTFGSLLGGIRAGGPVKRFEGDGVAGADLAATTPNYPIQSLNLSGSLKFHHRLALDEREQAERDHAHYRAYAILRWVLGIAAPLFFFVTLYTPLLLACANILVWTLLIFILSLPQCVILWTEPDQPSAGELTLVPERQADIS